jgi:hypothetical protein
MKIHILTVLLISSLTTKGQLCSPNSNSLLFDGHSTYVGASTNKDLNIKDEITIEAWIKAVAWASSPAGGTIVCKHGWTSGEKGYVLRAGGNGQLSFNFAGKNAGWQEVLSAPGALQLNTWHHVAGTYNGTTLKIFIDGVQAGSQSFNGEIETTANYKLKIGKVSDNGAANGRYWFGFIDEVRIWKKALSQVDIDNNKSIHIDPNSVNDLKGYWRLNDGSGTFVDDIGDGNNNGTLYNAVWHTDVPFSNGIIRPTLTDNSGVLQSSSLIGNQWNLNGIPISGATGRNYTPSSGGIYSVTVNYGLGCFATSLPYEIIMLGLNEPGRNSGFSFSIVDDVLQLSTGQVMVSSGTLEIFDLKGSKLVQTNNIYEPVSLAGLPAGLYIMNVFFDSNSYKTKLVLN